MLLIHVYHSFSDDLNTRDQYVSKAHVVLSLGGQPQVVTGYTQNRNYTEAEENIYAQIAEDKIADQENDQLGSKPGDFSLAETVPGEGSYFDDHISQQNEYLQLNTTRYNS